MPKKELKRARPRGGTTQNPSYVALAFVLLGVSPLLGLAFPERTGNLLFGVALQLLNCRQAALSSLVSTAAAPGQVVPLLQCPSAED